MGKVTKIWHSFTAAPHRVMFFGGAVQSIAVMAWWLYELLARNGLVSPAPAWAIPSTAAHAYLMIYGLLPFFMFGFLMTTFPRWMNDHEIPARRFMPAFLLMLLGALLFYAGLWLGEGLLQVAVSFTLLGWGFALYALLRVLIDTRPSDKRHTIVLWLALLGGWSGVACFLWWLRGGDWGFLNASIQIGLWLFLVPVFASVGHRMIPFFTGSALSLSLVPRPFLPWWIMLAGSVAHALLKLLAVEQWLWLADLPLALAAFYLSYLWGLRRSLKIPLLAVLHVGFLWLGLAMLFYALQSAMLWLDPESGARWGWAPLHALTLGCFATLMIGMGTRVTLGHSGLPFIIDTPLKLMFIGIQLVALLRVSAELLPLQNAGWLYVIAALGWLACFAPWVWRYLPAYWRPRADGQPG